MLKLCVQSYSSRLIIKALFFFLVFYLYQLLAIAYTVCLFLAIMLARAIVLIYYLIFRQVLYLALQVILILRLVLKALRSTNIIVCLYMLSYLILVNSLSLCAVQTIKSRYRQREVRKQHRPILVRQQVIKGLYSRYTIKLYYYYLLQLRRHIVASL